MSVFSGLRGLTLRYAHQACGGGRVCAAILDRFLHHVDIIKISGRSYRLKDRSNPKEAVDKESKA